jgi:hypothetical protein
MSLLITRIPLENLPNMPESVKKVTGSQDDSLSDFRMTTFLLGAYWRG